jgi:hypothetical protein
MVNENRKLSDLKLNRRNIKSSITRLQNGISNSENDIYQLQTDLETVTDLFKQYNSVQFEIDIYLNGMLPEITDSRSSRNLPIRSILKKA